MNPVDLYQKLLKDNNLRVELSPRVVSNVDDGSIIIKAQTLLIDWADPSKVEKEKDVKTS